MVQIRLFIVDVRFKFIITIGLHNIKNKYFLLYIYILRLIILFILKAMCIIVVPACQNVYQTAMCSKVKISQNVKYFYIIWTTCFKIARSCDFILFDFIMCSADMIHADWKCELWFVISYKFLCKIETHSIHELYETFLNILKQF
jgi:hypothetical protein